MMDRQLRFDGREIVQVKSKWADMEIDFLPEGMTREDLHALTIGDEVFVMARFVVDEIGHREKHDREGFGVKPLARRLTLKLLSKGFTVDGIVKHDAAADQEQEATR